MDDQNMNAGGDMGGEKKMCSCGMEMDAPGHAEMMQNEPDKHMPAEEKKDDMGGDQPAAM